MKNLILSIVLTSFVFTGCNSGNDQSKNTESKNTTASEAQITKTHPTQDIVGSYIKLKNALTKDDDKEAANAGNEIVKALESFDKSSLNEEQSKEYADIHEDAKEHAEHIAANKGNIQHQREHFETLSQDVYDLVKSVGGGQKLYVDYCPMYNKGKGGNWLSETKEIKNPYLGKEMPECGTVKEELN